MNTNFVPAGMDTYSATDTQMQIQTPPYPGSVTSHATSLGGEIERIRYQLAQLLGTTFWYNAPAASVSTLNSIAVPIGGVIDYPSATPPNANWALCAGQAASRAAFPALFTLIGTTFGVGNNDGLSFSLPDYRDRMSIGAGNSYALAATGGEATHTLVTAEIPAVTVTDPGHVHAITDPTHLHHFVNSSTVISLLNTSVGGPNAYAGGGSFAVANVSATDSQATGVTVNSHTTGITVAGGGGAHNNLPPYLGMYRMMRVL